VRIKPYVKKRNCICNNPTLINNNSVYYELQIGKIKILFYELLMFNMCLRRVEAKKRIISFGILV
jgi:hypothetical protein